MSSESSPEATPESSGAAAVSALCEELLEVVLDAIPVSASLLGIRDREDRMPDYTEAEHVRLEGAIQEIADRARNVDEAGLNAEDRVSRRFVVELAEVELDQLRSRATEYTIVDNFSSPAVEMFAFLPQISLGEPEHAEGYLARLGQFGEVFSALAERHRAGTAAGRTPVRNSVEATIAYLDRYLAAPEDDPLLRPEPPAETDVARFHAERGRLLESTVRPAMAAYRDALAELAPSGRPQDKVGLCWLPRGEEIYTGLVRAHTTTERTPDELHETGLAIVAELAHEYAAIGGKVFGTTDVSEIQRRLREDPALLWTDGEELLASARTAIARAEAVAPQWFGRLPGHSCVVEPVPENDGPGAAAAYYMPPALDGSRPGTYFANTYEADKRSRAGYESITFHEAVPGHHFQIALSQELTDLPLIRRLTPFTAYAEGWGLYAERLADEMGLFSSDVARLGMLAEDSVRAVRLVVDTGLHAKGWDRQRALDYMLANTAAPQVEVVSEIDRYIASPGQALAYMVGRLEIQRLRADAAASLGDRFDLRGFHDTVLGHGGLPLGVLDQVVADWVARVADARA